MLGIDADDDDAHTVPMRAEDARASIGELAGELCQSIDEGDRWLKVREDVHNNAMTIARTSNGDNHFPQERQEQQRRGAKEVHIVKTKEACGFNTWTKDYICLA